MNVEKRDESEVQTGLKIRTAGLGCDIFWFACQMDWISLEKQCQQPYLTHLTYSILNTQFWQVRFAWKWDVIPQINFPREVREASCKN